MDDRWASTGDGQVITGSGVTHLLPRFKMLRFLKKRWKPSPKPVPPENPTYRTTNTNVERDGDSEGGCQPRDRRAGEADGTDLTTAPDINHEEGSRAANQDGRIENQQFCATPGHNGGGNTGECGVS